jgi:hypothetical protein
VIVRFTSAFSLALVALASINASAQTGRANTTTGRPAAGAVWPDENSPLKWAPRPTVKAITANDLRTRLYGIADDSMQGRRVGEPGNFKTTAYIAREFQRLGLKPLGDSGTYFQNLPWGPTGVDSATARLAIGATALAPRRDWFPATPAANNGAAARADLRGVATVYAGRLDDTTVRLDPTVFRGKVAVFIAPPVGGGGGGGGRGGGGGGGGRAGPANVCAEELGFPSQRGAYDALANAARGGGGRAAAAGAAAPAAGGTAAGGAAAGGAAAAGGGRAAGGRGGGGGGRGGGAAAGTGDRIDPRFAAAGIVGVLLVSDSISPAQGNAGFGGRSGMRPNIPQGGLPTATVSSAMAARIFGQPVTAVATGTAGQPVTASWSYEWRLSRTPGRNVIAMLPGSDPARATQYVAVSAHNDHVGVNANAVDHDSLRAFNTIMRPQGANDQVNCRPNATQQRLIDSLIARARKIRPARRDSIMNGADDDGSGTVVLLEIAEAFAAEKPARSIVFISHEAEENGLLGSAWFVDHPTIPIDSIVAVHNMDMVGKGRVTDVRFGGPASVQSLGSRRLSTQFGDIIDSVNAISAEPMTIDKTWDVFANPLNRFCRSDQVNYVRMNRPVTYFSTGYSRDYHQQTDEPQYIDYDHSARLARFLHDVMTAIANRKDPPKIDGPDPNYPACR